MTTIQKTFLDHVLVQFSTGAEHQTKKPGEIEGAQFVEIDYFVDDATGAVVGRPNKRADGSPNNGQAKPLDPAKVSEILGPQFAAAAAQLAETQAELADAIAAAKSAADAADQKLKDAASATDAAAHQAASEIAARDDTIARLTTEHADAVTALNAQIALLTATHQDLTARNEAAAAALAGVKAA